MGHLVRDRARLANVSHLFRAWVGSGLGLRGFRARVRARGRGRGRARATAIGVGLYGVGYLLERRGRSLGHAPPELPLQLGVHRLLLGDLGIMQPHLGRGRGRVQRHEARVRPKP